MDGLPVLERNGTVARAEESGSLREPLKNVEL
jgi:hypothetical protein